MIQSLMHWISRHPWTAFAFTTLLCLTLGSGISRLEIDVSSEGVFIDGDPDRLFYEEVCETFGNDVFATIMIESDNVFEEDILKEIRELTEAGASIDGVTRVISLFTVNKLKSHDGLLDTEALIPEVPSDPEELQRIRNDALENEILLGEVLNPDGTATAVHLFIESRPDEKDFEKRITQSIRNLVDRTNRNFSGKAEAYDTGAPQVKVAIIDKIQHDRKSLLPLQASLLLLTLVFLARSLSAVTLPLITGGLSIIAALGFMGWIGFPITPVSIIIPSLILVIGATEDVHLVFAYHEALEGGQSRLEAIHTMIRTCAKPITLTSLTTFIGFATISFSPIPLVREFGIAASLGIAINFLITILMVPTCIRFFGTKKERTMKNTKDWWTAIENLIIAVSTRWRGALALAVLGVTLTFLYGITRLEVDTNYVEFFKPEDPIRVDYHRMHESLVGGANLLVVIDGGKEDAFLEPENLNHLTRLNEHLAGQHDKVLGYTNFIRRMHCALNDNDPAFYAIPDSSAHISQYNLLLPPQAIDRFMQYDYSRAKILIRSTIPGSSGINRVVAEIKEWTAKNFPDHLRVRVTGDNVLLGKSSERMSRDILINLGWVLVAVVVVVGLLFRSLAAGLISLVPNLLPTFSVFGMMGLLDIPLSTGTFPVAIIALGIAIDDTIHLMTRFAMESSHKRDPMLAMRQTIRQELGPVTTTSVALALGFIPLVLSDFATTAQFGLLTAIAMVVAWFADVLVTPALLLARSKPLKTVGPRNL